LPSVTVARSALAQDALSDVSESDDEHPVSVSAAAITIAAKIPKRFFTVAPFWLGRNRYPQRLVMM
jgi:hypothetical protein